MLRLYGERAERENQAGQTHGDVQGLHGEVDDAGRSVPVLQEGDRGLRAGQVEQLDWRGGGFWRFWTWRKGQK